MEIKKITFLPIEDMRIIKQIMIVSEVNSREFSIAYILYKRKLSSNYKFKETPIEERDNSYYSDYPKQDSYPTDNVDDIILQSIRNTFPKSTVRNYSLLCNVDEERVKVLQNRQTEKSEISFTPNLSQLDYGKYEGHSFDGLIKSIKIYDDFEKDKIKNIYFQAYYKLDDKDILAKINEIEFI